MGTWLARLVEIISKYRLDRYAELDWLVQKVRLGHVSEHDAQRYLMGLENAVREIENHPNLLHRPPDKDQFNDQAPDIEIGTLENGLRFGLQIRDRPRNVLCVGDAGSGKTTCIRRIIRGIDALADKRSIIVLDRKGDYCDLDGPNWVHLSVHDGLRLGLNAPGIPPSVWIPVVCTIFAARAGLIKAWACLARMMTWLVETLDACVPSQGLFPDFRLLLDMAKRAPLTLWSAKPDYEKSLIQSLEAFVLAGGRRFECLNGLDIERDIVAQGKSAVIDITNLDPPELRMLIIDLLLAQVLLHRIHHQKKMDATEVVIVLDECDRDISQTAEAMYPGEEFPLGQALAQLREYGVMFILGARIIGRASRFVLNSCPRQFIFNLPDAESIYEATRMLSLPRGAEVMLPALPPGTCIFRQSQSSWSHPMLATIDYVAPYRGGKPAYTQLPHVPSRSLDQIPELGDALRQLSDSHKAAVAREGKNKDKGLSEEAQELLTLSANNLWLPVARLWELMKTESSPKQRKAVVKEIEKARLAAFDRLRVKKTCLQLMLPTEDGWKHLGRAVPRIRGRGRTAHKHLAHWIASWARRQGLTVEVEHLVEGSSHHGDVGVLLSDGTWRVYECIDSCENNMAGHVEACFGQSTAVSEMVVVAGTRGQLNQVAEAIRETAQRLGCSDRIRFETIDRFMED